MNVGREEIDRLLGFVRHARTHLERGNWGAVREALDDAEARLLALGRASPPSAVATSSASGPAAKLDSRGPGPRVEELGEEQRALDGRPDEPLYDEERLLLTLLTPGPA